MKNTKPASELEIALDNLAVAARAFTMGESWATLDVLRGYSVAYTAAQIRQSGDNPDLARGGSIASYLELIAADMRPTPRVETPSITFADQVQKTDHLMTKEKFLDFVENGDFVDYDGFGCLATETTRSNITVNPSSAFTMMWPQWATHVVWYNK